MVTRPDAGVPFGRASQSSKAPLLVQEGCPRVQGADGVVAHRQSFELHSDSVSVSDHPVRSFQRMLRSIFFGSRPPLLFQAELSKLGKGFGTREFPSFAKEGWLRHK